MSESIPDPLAQAPSLQDDDFRLFGLPMGFALDRAALDERWKALQRQAHPDRFAAQGTAAQRVAMQWSVRINEAYQRLKDPLKRAAYWCELNGAPIKAERNTAMPATFLVQQMTWREALDYCLNNVGEFSLPPSRVEAMYAPEMFGESPNARVKVLEVK